MGIVCQIPVRLPRIRSKLIKDHRTPDLHGIGQRPNSSSVAGRSCLGCVRTRPRWCRFELPPHFSRSPAPRGVSGLGASKPFTFSRMRSFGLRSAMNFLISKKAQLQDPRNHSFCIVSDWKRKGRAWETSSRWKDIGNRM